MKVSPLILTAKGIGGAGEQGSRGGRGGRGSRGGKLLLLPIPHSPFVIRNS